MTNYDDNAYKKKEYCMIPTGSRSSLVMTGGLLLVLLFSVFHLL